MSSRTNLLRQLLEINIFQLGEFTLKSGLLSPVYIDLRGIIAYPNIVKQLAEEIHSREKEASLTTDVVCGVPYTALPIASIYSVLYQIPMVMKRKEAKSYGTKKMVEGITQKGVRCLIIEDIVTSGSSVIETAEVLRKEGLIVTDCIVILDRQQGAEENVTKAGIKLHSLFNINEIFATYCSINKVEQPLIESVTRFLKDNSYVPIKNNQSLPKLLFEERAKICNQSVAKALFEIIASKKSNLCVAVDSLYAKTLLDLADQLGPHICMLKTHIDILEDFSDDVPVKLKELAQKHKFLIFEDRKLADIGNTVQHQYGNGIYKIKQWADIVTVHGIPGSGIIEALKSASQSEKRSCVLIAEMSSKGTLTDESYMKKIAEMAENHQDYVIGFISQHKVSENPNFIQMSPGVNIAVSGDSLGQQYRSPEDAVSDGADVIIVGRGICSASDVIAAATEYKNRSYVAYINRCSKC
ncbi:Uridine 5'-monophosphate synthase like protein [Argiope bruennichi]|uniref:Uridine 5'-monophosphate synthase n=2 Tax=Argiope bruennichi TaxID=94029 RepID=A0A8T0EEA2_ARGBR|nr:Uridine 5'-monophosphate synthase like protein [Argiope bruennichi]